MLFATFRYMMGSVARFLSQLYSDYSLYINFVVLIYGISILWVHNNLRAFSLILDRSEGTTRLI